MHLPVLQGDLIGRSIQPYGAADVRGGISPAIRSMKTRQMVTLFSIRLVDRMGSDEKQTGGQFSFHIPIRAGLWQVRLCTVRWDGLVMRLLSGSIPRWSKWSPTGGPPVWKCPKPHLDPSAQLALATKRSRVHEIPSTNATLTEYVVCQSPESCSNPIHKASATTDFIAGADSQSHQ